VTTIIIEPPVKGDVVIGDSPRMEQALARLAKIVEIRDTALSMFGGDLDLQLQSVQVVEKVGCTLAEARQAWDQLVKEGLVTAHGASRGRYYTLAIT
jgi:hypothetical protein